MIVESKKSVQPSFVSLVVCARLAAAAFCASAAAAEITVTTQQDELIANNGQVSLREAVRSANQQSGPDTILLPPGYYQIALDAAIVDGNMAGNNGGVIASVRGDVLMTDGAVSGGGVYISGNSVLTLGGAAFGQQIQNNSPQDLINDGGTVLP